VKICASHWEKLRAAVDARGMSALVAKDGHAAIENTVLELEGREKEAYFDPLMGANNMIWSAALERIGLDLMVGEKCPVCEGITWNLEMTRLHGAHPSDHGKVFTAEEEERYWIDGPADAMLAVAREKGLVAP
jgi:hypothetical protein